MIQSSVISKLLIRLWSYTNKHIVYEKHVNQSTLARRVIQVGERTCWLLSQKDTSLLSLPLKWRTTRTFTSRKPDAETVIDFFFFVPAVNCTTSSRNVKLNKSIFLMCSSDESHFAIYPADRLCFSAHKLSVHDKICSHGKSKVSR